MQPLRTSIPTFTIRVARAATRCGRTGAVLATSVTVLGLLGGACTTQVPAQDEVDATEVGRAVARDAPQAVPDADGEALQLALDRTMDSTFRVKMTSTVRHASQTYVIGMQGAYSMPRRTGHMRVVLPGGTVSMDFVYTAKTIYVKGMPQLPADAWLGLPRKLARAHYLLRTPANDPRDVLRWCLRIQGVIGSRTDSGEPGKPPARYRGFLKFESILQYLAPGRRAMITDLGRQAVIQWVPAQVDVTSDGLVGSVDIRLDVPQGDVSMALRMNLFEHPRPLNVHEPDPRSVVPGRTAANILFG